VRVDSSNHNINEYTTPNTTLLDVTYQPLPSGELSVYSERDQSLLPGELSIYSERDQSLLPGEFSIYSEVADESFFDVSVQSDESHNVSQMLQRFIST
jgi:hypothetical protein